MTATSFRSSARAAKRRSGSTTETRAVLRSEKPKKKKGSLDDLLVSEHKRQGEFDRKFDATFELQKEKHSKADELFKKALEKAEKGEDEEGS